MLLPLPLAPTTAHDVPAGTLNDTPSRMAESGRYLNRSQPSTVPEVWAQALFVLLTRHYLYWLPRIICIEH